MLAVAPLLGWLCNGALDGQEYRTPRAGEAFSATVFGSLVAVKPRQRESLTAINLGVLTIPSGPQERKISPFGGVFFWRNRDEGERRIRAVLVGLYDDVRANSASAIPGPLEGVLSFQNTYLPFARSEYVEGRRIAAEELKWSQFQAGVGIGYRRIIAPGHQDNALEIALTYEPGVLLFGRGNETDPLFVLPQDTYEGRVHLRLRADAFERNLLELPHRGFAAGLDALYGHRADWEDWGGPALGPERGGDGRNWSSVSVYALAAGPLPFSTADRHRLILRADAGIGSDLDRFSAFRLGSRPNAGEWESLSQPMLPASALDEFYTSEYAAVSLEYRYEVLFFLYLQLRGGLAWVERPRFAENGAVVQRTQPMHWVAGGLTSGFLWNSVIEIGYAYNFGLYRQREGESRRGGSAILFSFSKEF